MCFIDLQKAYDSVGRKLLCADWKTSDERGNIPFTCATSTFRKRMTLSTASCCGRPLARLGVAAKMPAVVRHIPEGEGVAVTACTRHGLMSRWGCDTAARYRHCLSSARAKASQGVWFTSGSVGYRRRERGVAGMRAKGRVRHAAHATTQVLLEVDGRDC